MCLKDALADLINTDDLLASAQKLEDIAYSYPERNRVFGGAAHNETLKYIYDELVATGYYDVYYQPQIQVYAEADQSLSVEGDAIEAAAMTYSGSGNVTAELVVASNLGCNAVSRTMFSD